MILSLPVDATKTCASKYRRSICNGTLRRAEICRRPAGVVLHSVADMTKFVQVRTRNNVRPNRAAPAYDEEVRLSVQVSLVSVGAWTRMTATRKRAGGSNAMPFVLRKS